MSIPVYLSLGAGVQSSTLALMAACGEITPMPTAAIFADTQDEPVSVYRWLDWLENQLPFPVHRVTNGKLSDEAVRMRVSKKGLKFSETNIPLFTLSENGEKGKIPLRSCTRDFKIRPIIKQVRKLVGRDRVAQWHRDSRKSPQEPLAIQWIGISRDEMQRMKDSRDPWIRCEWPLVERIITRAMCVSWMCDKGFPEPPRSACVYCPFHNNAEWRRLKNDEPEAFERAVKFEKDIQAAKSRGDMHADSIPFLHRSCKPLDTIDFRNDIDRGQMLLDGFEDECDGMCGV
jgi:hypothetical protein